MPAALRRIEHIVVVLMENRSFDHVLGYLSRPGGRADVDGIGDDAWRAAHANPGAGAPLAPFALNINAIPDPPHERDTIAMQIGTAGTPGSMQGFVRSYASRQPPPNDVSLVMGFYLAQDVPIADFFATQYAICDRWFAALPTGTQPNRLMAMSGTTARDVNAPVLLADQDLVYDWLTARSIPWRVYHHGVLPFFALMPKWQPVILHELAIEILGLHTRFRRYEHFARDVHADPTFPPVVFIEPEYTDGPHHAPDDDHPPTPIARGQAFLRSVYQALTANPERWHKTLLLITYDEHGGFYDHVPPLAIRTDPPLGHVYPSFETTGVRVPAFLVSPFVDPGAVVHTPLDHTALLAFLGERFDPGATYSPVVDARQGSLSRLANALTRTEPRTDIPVPPAMPAAVVPMAMRTALPLLRPTAMAPGAAANAHAFEAAAREMVRRNPLAALQLLPDLAMFREPPQAP
jgi:phospholipase C